MKHASTKERGAAAIEFALVLPILVLLIVGIFEFGRLFNVQLTLSNAAREGARVMAINDDPSEARSAAIAAAPVLNPAITDGQIDVSPDSCDDNPGDQVEVVITYEVALIAPDFWEWATGDAFTLQGKGQMVCGG
jgi:Flp pilus assembly protein TadG